MEEKTETGGRRYLMGSKASAASSPCICSGFSDPKTTTSNHEPAPSHNIHLAFLTFLPSNVWAMDDCDYVVYPW